MTRRKQETETVEQALARMNADPLIVGRRAEADRVREERAWQLDEAEAPLVASLRAVGYPIASVWDFVNTQSSYPAAIPVLLEHLARPYPPEIREGIARALGVAEARNVWPTLREMFCAEGNERVKDGLGVAVAGAFDDSRFDDVVELLRDKSLGPSRLFLLHAIERSADVRARKVLEDLAARKPAFKPEVVKSLRRMQRANR